MASWVETKLSTFKVENNHLMSALVGANDEHLKLIERSFPDTKILVRGNEVLAEGQNAEQVVKTFKELVGLIERGNELDLKNVGEAIKLVQLNLGVSEILSTDLLKSAKGRSIKPKTLGQKRYVDAILNSTITVAIGPAGTGKSYLGVAMAVASIQAKAANRIILTRPAVEAGERLGFLPGDLMAKVDPYLRPLFDALFDILDSSSVQKLMEKNIVEVAPLAYMRGRTLNDSFVILDEAQNTTKEQMKMFLTRLGFNSKMVITGDITQIDIEGGRKKSGLVNLPKILAGIDSISVIYLDEGDVVRHPLVSKIVKAYSMFEEKNDNLL